MLGLLQYKLTNRPYGWGVHRTGERFIGLREQGKDANGLLTMTGLSGTHDAYINIIDANVDFAIICRKPSPDELAHATERKVNLEIEPLARDALVFIVNRQNPVKGLTLAQIQGIYTDKISNWHEVSGPNEPIAAIQREKNSGSQELMMSLVMKDLKMAGTTGVIVSGGMMGPYNQLEEDKNALAYSVWYYNRYIAKPLPLQAIEVDGVAPTAENVASMKYPLTAEVYVVIRKVLGKEHKARVLRDWLLTEDGQALVAASGYAPIKPPKDAQTQPVGK